MTEAGDIEARRTAILERWRRKRLHGGAGDMLAHEMTDYDVETATAICRFESRPDFLNLLGVVQGGYLAAMMDEAITDAIVIATDYRYYIPTLSLSMTFIAPAWPGHYRGEGRVTHLGRSTVFAEGRLFDAEGTLLATAHATTGLTAPKLKDG